MDRRPGWRLAAVVLVALVGITVIAALRDDDASDPDDAPQQYLDAWSRSQAAAFRVVAEFTRVSNSTGGRLSYQLIIAQRPPDRLRIDGSGGSGLVDGRRLVCTFPTRVRLRCRTAPAERTYDEEVADQLRALSGYVLGDQPLYDTVADLDTDRGDCFELRLARRIVAPPLGIVSRYCFDPETGAPTDTHIEAVEAVDDIQMTELRDEVTDADLDPDTALG